VALSPGDTVHIPDTGPPRERGKPHLFVMLTSPCSKGMALLAPICTIRGKWDPTCRVAPGAHPFVTEDSYVAYYHLKQFKVAVLEKQIEQKILRTNDPISAALLKRICDGVVKSGHAPPVEKKYYQQRVAEEANKQKAP
jgi:hypothetical protein